MATAFAALETRINAAIQKSLANAVAVINDTEITGIFDNGYQAALSGFVESSAPTFLCQTADVQRFVDGTSMPRVTGLTKGSAITIAEVQYKVLEIHPDGTGLSTIILEKA